jgi:monoamine oxidase
VTAARPSRRTFLAGAGAIAVGGVAARVPALAAGPTTPARGVPDPIGYVITRWADDPFALGSYSYLGVGASNDDRRSLAAPVDDRVFFAGEATSAEYAATVHGAYLSGVRAAQQVDDVAAGGARVIVVGAGVSGLTAARDLTEAGYDVTVVEGRDRLGGRIHTVDDLGPPLDLGASWIHGVRGNPITELADGTEIPRSPTDSDNGWLYLPDGERATGRQEAAIYDQYTELLAAVEGPRERREADISLGRAMERVVRRRGWSEAEQVAVGYAVSVTIEHEYAGGVDELSLFWWDAGKGFPGGDVLLPETGYAWLPILLADGLDVRRGEPVELIERGADGVRVRTTTGEGRADHVVVTVPLGVLQRGTITFEPALPARTQQAIARLGMGLLDKLWLRFPRVFWDRDVDLFGYVSTEHGRWNEWYDLWHHTGEPILIGFNAADYARRLEPQSDAEIVADAMSVLRTIYA